MRLSALLALAAAASTACAPSPEPVDIEFPSSDAAVHGVFFPTTATDPLGTLLLLPGWGFEPGDVLGLGGLLSAQDVNVLTFTPRGTHQSEGTLTFANALDDIGAALRWLRGPAAERFGVDPARITVGGHSFGGGFAVAYAARDTTVRRVISIAGADHGEYARLFRRDTVFVAGLRKTLASYRAPEGALRFDPDAFIQEIIDHEAEYGQRENAARLADRAILLFCGWDDTDVRLETMTLPAYRALAEQPGADVTIVAYQDDHSFGKSREKVASEIRVWLGRHPPR